MRESCIFRIEEERTKERKEVNTRKDKAETLSLAELKKPAISGVKVNEGQTVACFGMLGRGRENEWEGRCWSKARREGSLFDATAAFGSQSVDDGCGG